VDLWPSASALSRGRAPGRTFLEILREINGEALQAEFTLEDVEWGLRGHD
jgi:hypothetical protein